MGCVAVTRNPSVDALPRKPMARVARVNLFEREVRERLSDCAVDVLIAHAKVLSEGECARSLRGAPGGLAPRSAFFGTTMLTIDLARLGDMVRDACDDGAALKVADLIATDERVAKRVRGIAEREAARLAGAPVRAAQTEMRVRARGATLYIDVDIEGDLAAAGMRR
jgi:hypothetical protein